MSSEKLVRVDPAGPEVVHVENLHVHFSAEDGRLRRRELGTVRAVDGVSFTLRQGEVLALVGAPGCGKTAVARTVGLLERPTSGRIRFLGQELTTGRSLRSIRSIHSRRARRQIQMLFSNPYTAFAPRMTVEDILSEALALGERQPTRDREQRLAELLTQVGLNLYLAVRYPRDLSGGTRQRLALARALAAEPVLLICDQPTDFLDPAMSDVFVELLQQVRQRLGLTMLLTARQLKTAAYADRVAVLVLGRIVEMGYTRDLLREPLHPFTQALVRPHSSDLFETVGRTLDPLNRASGCFYAPLCPFVESRCHARFPAFVEAAPEHGAACYLVELD
jgi:oligopeptide transport system ATP-binding protein